LDKILEVGEQRNEEEKKLIYLSLNVLDEDVTSFSLV